MAKIIFSAYVGMLPVSQNALTSGTNRNKVYKYTAPMTAGDYYRRLRMRLEVTFSKAMEAVKKRQGPFTFVLMLPHTIAGKSRYDLDNFAYPIFTSSKRSGLMRLMNTWHISKSHDVHGGFEVSIYEGC
jgi:hypothetical protein